MPYPSHHLLVTLGSIAMLQPGTKALYRAEVMRFISKVQDLERRMRALRDSLLGMIGDKTG